MEESWKHFAATGRVTDYLKYKEEELLSSNYQNRIYNSIQEVIPDGNKPSGDGAGDKYDAHWRV